MAASMKYGKPEVYAGDAHNDGRIQSGANQPTDIAAQIGNNTVTIDNANNESLTYI